MFDLTQKLEDNRELISEWMAKKRSEVPIPIYGSVDIRDAGWKVAVVDANHFPAGFNNTSPEDEPHLAALLRNHIKRKHKDVLGSIFTLSHIQEIRGMSRMLQQSSV